MRAVVCRQFGGPEVLTLAEMPEPEPVSGGRLVEVAAAGVNFADTRRVEGSYGGGQTLPFIPGTEVVGYTADGSRVAALSFAGGGYAERAFVPDTQAIEVPDGVSDGAALALLVQGLTAWHLLATSARLGDGESVVVNAAAGGVGSLAVQVARVLGAGRVIAAASTVDKRAVTLRLGADAAIDSDPVGYAERVRAANGGRGVDVVLESTGGPAFTAGLDALDGFGRLVTYGNASRLGRPLVDPELLAEHNRAVVGFWLRPALSRPSRYIEPLRRLLALTASGRIRPLVGAEYPLAHASQAHEDLLARRSTGKLVLRP